METVTDAEVIIIGGGPSGLSLAASLGTAGLTVLVLERGPPKPATFDGRTLALSFRSMTILRKAGVADFIENSACPILDIHVGDGAAAYLDFSHKEVGDQPFGWIVEHHLFQKALERRLKGLKNVQIIHEASIRQLAFSDPLARVTLKGGRVLAAPLLIGADGRNSDCRMKAGIPVYGWTYKQTAIACVVRHTKPHQNCAVESFQPGGPFATLPMTKQRSSIIWTDTKAAAGALISMDHREFTKALDAKVEGWLGTTQLLGERFSYPLRLQHAERYTAPRLALIGDAAHSIHPIAGQGFNLGMGDIAVLTEELARAVRLGLDPGDAGLLRRYEQRRKAENGNMVLMTDSLVRLFSNSIAPLAFARRFGLETVQNMPPLKRFFIRTAMGTSQMGTSRMSSRRMSKDAIGRAPRRTDLS